LPIEPKRQNVVYVYGKWVYNLETVKWYKTK
jgi:hypothetical protein